MAFEPRSPGNFNFQSPVNPAAEAALAQRKAEIEGQQKLESQQNTFKAVQGAVAAASDAVTGMVQRSKANQRKQFIDSLANSLALIEKDPNKRDALRTAVQLDPESFTNQMGKTMAGPSAAPKGTPPRSFESYVISQVNSGAMTPEDAAKALSSYKPSNVVIGYTTGGQPIYSNTKATKPGAQPLPLNGVTGPVQEKPERVSEIELGKQADVENLRIASKEIEKNFDKRFVGPLQGRLNTAAQTFDKTASTKRANFITGLASYRNSVIKAITGAQMSEPEATRIMKQLPNEKMSETDFKAKLRLSRLLLEQGLEKRRKQLSAGGFTGVPSESITQEAPIAEPNIDALGAALGLPKKRK